MNYPVPKGLLLSLCNGDFPMKVSNVSNRKEKQGSLMALSITYTAESMSSFNLLGMELQDS